MPQTADFTRDADLVRRRINKWVEEETRKRIRDLIPAAALTADTRLVLASAIWFKGLWALAFENSATRERPFYLARGGHVRVPQMFTQREMRYVQAEDFQAVELPYLGGELSMVLFVPDRRDGLPSLESRLSEPLIQQTIAQMVGRKVELFLPRFQFEWGPADVGAALSEMGMPLAFQRGTADFSGINGVKPPSDESLFLSVLLHKAFVEVTERGTEAAAATAAVIMTIAALRPPQPPPIPTVRADHPFFFALRDQPTGAILFMGRVMNPAVGK